MYSLIDSVIAVLAFPNFGQWTKIAVSNLAAVGFVLGVLVFVHEFGHYAVAKLFRIRVEVFSLGFGKRLWGFRRGDTDYRVSLLPLGGYVKMAGENPMEERTGDPGEFASHPRWHRFLVAIAGPAMNIILAIAVLAGLYMVRHGYDAYTKAPVDIVWVTPDTPAAKADLQLGDRIIKVQDVENPTWLQFRTMQYIRTGQPMELTIRRNERTFNVTVVPEPKGKNHEGDIGIVHPEVVGELAPGPAAQAGVKEGDVLVSLDGFQIKSIEGMLEALQKSKDKQVQLTVLRDGKELKLAVSPQILPGFSDKKYRMGLPTSHLEKLPFRLAVTTAYADCKENSLLIFKLVGTLFQRPAAIQQMSGPIGIMQVSGDAARTGGLPSLLYVMALISLNLAIFNLFPIPILDGGLITMLLIEAVMRRDIKQEIKERVYQVAFVLLIMFAAVVIYNDVAKSLPSRTHVVQ